MKHRDLMKLVIAYDGSEHANAALDDLRHAGLPHEAQAVVVTVSDPLMPPPPPSAYEFVKQGLASRRVASLVAQGFTRASQALEEARAVAFEGIHRVRAHFPDWKISAEGMAGSPAEAVMQKARDWNADLIIAGSHGRSALGRFFLGSVSRKLATESCCSVRVGRGRIERDNTRLRIIIGADGSPGAEQAVRAVGMRIWPDGTEVRLIAVNEGTGLIAGDLPIGDLATECSNEAAPMTARLSEWSNELCLIRLNASAEIKEGDPRSVLIEEADKWNAHSIFVGARGQSTQPEGSHTGSVATAVVTNAHCSVEVVRANMF